MFVAHNWEFNEKTRAELQRQHDEGVAFYKAKGEVPDYVTKNNPRDRVYPKHNPGASTAAIKEELMKFNKNKRGDSSDLHARADAFLAQNRTVDEHKAEIARVRGSLRNDAAATPISKAEKLGKAARKASHEAAYESGHRSAAGVHSEAADAYRAAGNLWKAQEHDAMAEKHLSNADMYPKAKSRSDVGSFHSGGDDYKEAAKAARYASHDAKREYTPEAHLAAAEAHATARDKAEGDAIGKHAALVTEHKAKAKELKAEADLAARRQKSGF